MLSSVSEGFPNVIVEYMASGRPVVSTDVGGAGEAIVEGETGYLVRPGDSDAMADRIIRLLQHDERRKAMGAQGRAIALAKFSCESQLMRTEAIYDRLLNRRQQVETDCRPASSSPYFGSGTVGTV